MLDLFNSRDVDVGIWNRDYVRLNISFDTSDAIYSPTVGTIIVDGDKVILLKPMSFMNLSGEVVRRYADYFKINIDDIDISISHCKAYAVANVIAIYKEN